MGLTRPRAYQIYDIDYKQAVRVISKNNVTLGGGAPSQVDGVNLSLNDRVLVAGQNNGAQNGLYYVTTVGSGSNGTWQRSIDGNETGEILAGMIVMVTEGTTYADTQWKLITNNPITIGVTALTFEQTSAYSFGSIAVSGQSSIVADTVGDVLTVIAGNNIALTTDSVSDALTISVTGISLNSISNGSSNVNVVSSGGNVTIGVDGTSNLAVFSTQGLAVAGNVSASNINLSGNIVDSNALSIITASGNVSLAPGGTNVIVATSSGANITGTLSATGNATVGNLSTTTVTATTVAGTLSTASQPNITTVGTLGSLSVTGNISGGNVSGTRGVFTNLVGTLETAAQPNITSVGTLSSLSVTGNVTGGNLTTGGQLLATGNITGGNLLVQNNAVINGDLTVTGNATLTGNILGDRILNGNTQIEIDTPGGIARVSVGGVSNVALFTTSGIDVTGNSTATGNIVGENIIASGRVIATGNVVGNTFIGNGSELTGIYSFATIAVSGQSNVVAEVISDTLTLSAGSGIAITTDAGNDIVTISSIANESIFATGGSMGTIVEVTTVSEDLGLITGVVIDSYDLGTITTGGIVAPSLLLLPSYTVSGLPNADPAGQMVFVSNESGGSVPAFSDGTNWRRVTDRTIVS